MTIRELQSQSRSIRQSAVDVWCERRYLATAQHQAESERIAETAAEIREALREVGIEVTPS